MERFCGFLHHSRIPQDNTRQMIRKFSAMHLLRSVLLFRILIVRIGRMISTFSILIAEDDPILREAYLRRFAHTSFRIRTAENGEQALAEITKEAPDLLICDIMMPVHDGVWVLEQLPKNKRTFPVIMLTNMEDDASHKQCKELGVDGYLIKKDMSLHTLVDMAEKLLNESAQSPTHDA